MKSIIAIIIALASLGASAQTKMTCTFIEMYNPKNELMFTIPIAERKITIDVLMDKTASNSNLIMVQTPMAQFSGTRSGSQTGNNGVNVVNYKTGYNPVIEIFVVNNSKTHNNATVWFLYDDGSKARHIC